MVKYWTVYCRTILLSLIYHHTPLHSSYAELLL
jgi:hypothetical protein